MLKRQRQPSPPPSSSVPLIADDIPNQKRRRIQPPVLDGDARGRVWEPEDDGEEDDYDLPASNQWPVVPQASPSSEYKSANSVLHDLHALHRHRIVFSSSNFDPNNQYSPLPNHPTTKASLSPEPLHYHASASATKSPPSSDFSESTVSLTSEGMFAEEQRVKERYEDTNKCVDLLFNQGQAHKFL